MGSLNKNNANLPTRLSQQTFRSKGERLGWGAVSEQKKRPLREIIGEGEKVNLRDYSIVDTSIKLLIP